MTSIRGADAAVKALEDLNVKYVFGLPGRWILPFYDALSNSQIRHISMYDERSAAHAADGYARASREIGVCAATSGPGAMGLTLGIATAYKDHSPVLAITGQLPSKRAHPASPEYFELHLFFQPITKKSILISSADEAYPAIINAHQEAISGCHGPVHLSFPEDSQTALSKTEVSTFQLHVEPPKFSIEEAANLLLSAAKPLILAGRGVLHAKAESLLIKAAEHLRIPVATTLAARGVIPEDHPLCLGPAGVRGSHEANRAMDESDFVLALGCSLSPLTMRFKKPLRLLQVDIAPQHFNENYADRFLQADARDFLEALLQFTPQSKQPWIQGGQQAYPQVSSLSMRFAKAIASMHSGSTFVLDIGQHTIWLLYAIKALRPLKLIFSHGMAAMGFALPAAIGAKLARPEDELVAVMGDGGLYTSLQNLLVLRDLELPMVIYVFNNQGYGLIRQTQEQLFKKTYAVEFGEWSITKIAEAIGLEAVQVEAPEALDPRSLKNVEESTLVELLIPPEDKVPTYR